jgi:hypothetical protein
VPLDDGKHRDAVGVDAVDEAVRADEDLANLIQANLRNLTTGPW